MKITKREIKFFLIGFFSILIIETIFNWKNYVKAYEIGYYNATHKN